MIDIFYKINQILLLYPVIFKLKYIYITDRTVEYVVIIHDT